MENLANWFYMQLTSSAEAFAWAIEQMPEERLWIAPPPDFGEWPSARHVFHLLSYERRLALPSIRIWHDETFERDETYEENVAWENAAWAKEQNLSAMLADFRQVRSEQIALVATFDAPSWQRTLPTPAWGEVTLPWVLTKTLQHTFEHTHNILQMRLFWDYFVNRTDDKSP